MPNVTSAWTKGNKQELKTSIETVLKMTMMFTLPMALGLSVLSHQVMGFIYSSPDIVQIGGNVLTLMGITTIFTGIITPICSMLNGIGKVKLPMILYTVCMLVKIGTSWIFVSMPSINIQGATAGSLISYALICVVGMYLLVKYSKIVPNFFSTTVKPLIGAVGSSAVAYFVNALLAGHMNHRLSTIIAIVAAAIIYIAILLILRTFSAQEVKILPKGEKIAKTLEKLHLIG
jgi:stage V sporulation protein B